MARDNKRAPGHCWPGARGVIGVPGQRGVPSQSRWQSRTVSKPWATCADVRLSLGEPGVDGRHDVTLAVIEDSAERSVSPRQLHLGETDRKPPGLGRMPWKEIKTALDDAAFDGSLVMEPFVMSGGQVGRDVGVWRPIIENPDLDALARASLKFVRANLV